ncbi:MAG: ATP-binding cassette domain-containing protein, partial [Chloroflexi bacterium]|nr:ATP-binding cassette domain-containing protein [Chloroflexota bacterium]
EQISAWDNIMVVLTERRLIPSLLERVKPAHRETAERILREVGMWEKRDAMAGELSYGQRKLLEIGRALAMDAQTYLFDEPFAGLFPQMLERVKEIVVKMREQGRTLIFISHNMDIVRELPDHLIVLDSGRLLTEGEVDDVLSREDVIEAYLGE